LNKWLRQWLGIDELEGEIKFLTKTIGDMDTEHRRQIQLLSSQLAEQVSVAVNVCIYEESTIIVTSKLGNGRVHIIRAKFNTLMDLQKCVDELEYRYGASVDRETWDMPKGYERKRIR
jgi:hypothetical protein